MSAPSGKEISVWNIWENSKRDAIRVSPSRVVGGGELVLAPAVPQVGPLLTPLQRLYFLRQETESLQTSVLSSVKWR